MTKELHKKSVFILLGISFILSLLSDLIYGTAAIAQEYKVGQFMSGLSDFAMSIFIILALLYLILRVVFKDMLDMMFPYHHSSSITSGYRNYGSKEFKWGKYSKEETDFVIKNHKKMTQGEIADHLNRTRDSVKSKLTTLGFRGKFQKENKKLKRQLRNSKQRGKQ